MATDAPVDGAPAGGPTDPAAGAAATGAVGHPGGGTITDQDGAIVLDAVAHTYDGRGGSVVALDTTDLTVGRGEFVVVVGPSGCGKSTLLRLIAGFVRPASGRVVVDGDEVRGPAPGRGVVFQQPTLYPWLSVAGNVELGLKLQKVPRRERTASVVRHLDLVGLADFADAAPYELSGGMQQRCQLARVLATDPSLLLMDEPFGALDALTRERLQTELRHLWVEQRRTVVFVTHSVEEAVLLGTRVLVMSPRPGRVVLDLDLPFARTGARLPELRTDPGVLAAAERLRAAIDHGGDTDPSPA